VEKTVEEAVYDRHCTWDMAKSVEPPVLRGSAGETMTATWMVDAIRSESYGPFIVRSYIYIHNPGDTALPFTIRDVLDDGTVSEILYCSEWTIEPGDTVWCYSRAMARNASATWNEVVVSVPGQPDVVATAPVHWQLRYDGCYPTHLSDPRFGYEERLDESTRVTFPEDFQCPVDPLLYKDGAYQFDETNQATLDGWSPPSGSATLTVLCELPVAACPRSPGYWMTHSKYMGAPRDAAWDMLPNAEDTIFFLSGKTYYEVMRTPPANNSYFQLSFQFIAAELNALAGVQVPAEVQAAMAEARSLFETYRPAELQGLRGHDLLRRQVIALAGILNRFNEGHFTPHCPMP
jgi:hypothetical protein